MDEVSRRDFSAIFFPPPKTNIRAFNTDQWKTSTDRSTILSSFAGSTKVFMFDPVTRPLTVATLNAIQADGRIGPVITAAKVFDTLKPDPVMLASLKHPWVSGILLEAQAYAYGKADARFAVIKYIVQVVKKPVYILLPANPRGEKWATIDWRGDLERMVASMRLNLGDAFMCSTWLSFIPSAYGPVTPNIAYLPESTPRTWMAGLLWLASNKTAACPATAVNATKPIT